MSTGALSPGTGYESTKRELAGEFPYCDGSPPPPPPRRRHSACIDVPVPFGEQDRRHKITPKETPSVQSDVQPGERKTVMSFFGLPDLPRFGGAQETPTIQAVSPEPESSATIQLAARLNKTGSFSSEEEADAPPLSPGSVSFESVRAATARIPGRLTRSRIEERLLRARSFTKERSFTTALSESQAGSPLSSPPPLLRAPPQAPEWSRDGGRGMSQVVTPITIPDRTFIPIGGIPAPGPQLKKAQLASSPPPLRSQPPERCTERGQTESRRSGGGEALPYLQEDMPGQARSRHARSCGTLPVPRAVPRGCREASEYH